jgi:hypothetical protein
MNAILPIGYVTLLEAAEMLLPAVSQMMVSK